MHTCGVGENETKRNGRGRGRLCRAGPYIDRFGARGDESVIQAAITQLNSNLEDRAKRNNLVMPKPWGHRSGKPSQLTHDQKHAAGFRPLALVRTGYSINKQQHRVYRVLYQQTVALCAMNARVMGFISLTPYTRERRAASPCT